MLVAGEGGAIPGGRRPAQVEDNVAAADLPAPSQEVLDAIKRSTQSAFVRWCTILVRLSSCRAGEGGAIPGGRRPAQVEDNVAAADLPTPSKETLEAIQQIYTSRIRPLVHHYW
jgi:aryl-alcohol dehydrogenase-like predicted oxidoreductase